MAHVEVTEHVDQQEHQESKEAKVQLDQSVPQEFPEFVVTMV